MHATAMTCRSAARRQSAALLRIIVPLCLVLACGGGGTEPARPSALAITSSVPATRSSGVDGLIVTVELRDGGGSPVASAGVSVSVSVAGGNATLSGTTTHATDADGKAVFNDLVLTGTVGTYTLTFTAPGLTPASTTPITLGAGRPASMVVTPLPLTGTVGAPLATPPSVTVKDASGNGVPGVTVVFLGLGQMTGDSPTTNAAGVATLGSWTLPTKAGQYELQVMWQGSPFVDPLRIPVTATAGAPASIIAVGSEQQAMYLAMLPIPVFVQVDDKYGNPVPGVPITWASVVADGVVTPLNLATDAGGQARANYRLGSMPGESVIIRASVGSPGLTVDIRATARAFSDHISVSLQHSCALDALGVAYCWGENLKGQLGDGTTTNRSAPKSIGFPLLFTRISVHNAISCALSTAGAAFCWGSNGWAGIGDGTTTDRSVPTPVAGPIFREITTGGSVTCALEVGSTTAYCWGANTHGQLGAGPATLEACSTSMQASFPCSTRPVVVDGGHAWASISAGDNHVCAITTTADLYCWGEGSSFGAPSGSTPAPVLVAPGMKFAEVSAGGAYTCGLTQASSAVYCWGLGGFGEVGTGTLIANQTTPAQVLASALSMDAGQLGTCAVLPDRRAQCWGLNESGAVGDGTTTNRSTPTTVATGLIFTSISASGDHSCAQSSVGQLWCWGNDSAGQLGIGSGTGMALTPQLVRP